MLSSKDSRPSVSRKSFDTNPKQFVYKQKMPKIEDGMVNRNSNLPTNCSSLQKILNLNTMIAEKNPESPFIHMSGDGDSVAGNLGEAKVSDEGVSL